MSDRGPDPRPLGNRVLVVPEDDAEHATEGGVVLPERVAEARTWRKGVVLSVGRGYRHYDTTGETWTPMDVRPGDLIAWQRGAEWEVSVEGRTYTLVDEPSILLVLDEALVLPPTGAPDAPEALQ